MGFLLESPVQLADSQGPYLSTPKGALQPCSIIWRCTLSNLSKDSESLPCE